MKIKLLLLSIMSLSLVLLNSCGPEPTKPKPDPDPVEEKEEFFTVQGVKITGDMFDKKIVEELGGDSILTIEYRDTSLVIQHEGGTMTEKNYEPSWVFSEDYVRIRYNTGILFTRHRYEAIMDPTPAHGVYSLTRENGKWVSEFKDTQLECVAHGTPPDDYSSITGRVVWENYEK